MIIYKLDRARDRIVGANHFLTRIDGIARRITFLPLQDIVLGGVS